MNRNLKRPDSTRDANGGVKESTGGAISLYWHEILANLFDYSAIFARYIALGGYVSRNIVEALASIPGIRSSNGCSLSFTCKAAPYRTCRVRTYAGIVSPQCTKSEKPHKSRISGRLVVFPLFCAASKAKPGLAVLLFVPPKQAGSLWHDRLTHCRGGRPRSVGSCGGAKAFPCRSGPPARVSCPRRFQSKGWVKTCPCDICLTKRAAANIRPMRRICASRRFAGPCWRR